MKRPPRKLSILWGVFPTRAAAMRAQEEIMRRTIPHEARETAIYPQERRWRFSAGIPPGYATRKGVAQ